MWVSPLNAGAKRLLSHIYFTHSYNIPLDRQHFCMIFAPKRYAPSSRLYTTAYPVYPARDFASRIADLFAASVIRLSHCQPHAEQIPDKFSCVPSSIPPQSVRESAVCDSTSRHPLLTPMPRRVVCLLNHHPDRCAQQMGYLRCGHVKWSSTAVDERSLT